MKIQGNIILLKFDRETSQFRLSKNLKYSVNSLVSIFMDCLGLLAESTLKEGEDANDSFTTFLDKLEETVKMIEPIRKNIPMFYDIIGLVSGDDDVEFEFVYKNDAGLQFNGISILMGSLLYYFILEIIAEQLKLEVSSKSFYQLIKYGYKVLKYEQDTQKDFISDIEIAI